MVFLHGLSAVAFWLSSIDGPEAYSQVEPAEVSGCTFSRAAVREAHLAFPQLPLPLHMWAPLGANVSNKDIVAHYSRLPVGAKCFSWVASDICVANPELAFMESCRGLSFHAGVKVGSALLARFRVEPFNKSGTEKRKAVMTAASLRSFLDGSSNIAGVKRTRDCADYLTEDALSPPEVFLRMALSLPMPKGGLGIDGLVANQEIFQGAKGRAIARRQKLIPDLYHPEARVAIEYDSDAMHLTGVQAARDGTKRLALEEAGIRVVSITSSQLKDKEYLERVARVIYARLGKQFRVRSKTFEEERGKLFAVGPSLGRLFDAMWVKQRMVEGERARNNEALWRL